MAEIAVTLATAAAEHLVGELVDGLVGELSLLRGVRGDVKFIIDELEIMGVFLRDAEEKKSDDQLAGAWVKQVRELAYDVEDCIDDFSLHLHRGTHPNPLARLGRSLISLPARHRIATQMQDIKRRVEEVSGRRSRYASTANAAIRAQDCADADADADADVRKFDPRLSALFVEDSQLVGIDGPRQELVRLLLDGAVQLSLIAVVGGGGLGKTTIAKKAYDDPRVTGGHFDCSAWITVSQTYNVEGILRDIIKQLIPAEGPSSKRRVRLIEEVRGMERVQLIEKLNVHLQRVRYIIVFDDVWKIDAWKSLEMALPKNELGSRIILTTRNKELAESARATPNIHGHIYHHNKLTPEDSMELFLRRVFKDPEQKACPEDLDDLAQAILEKCDGLPLAIISIAGVLASKPNKSREEWEKMLRRLGSELEHNPNLEGLSQILTLSYNDLPYHVRYCFLYLSKFPEDYDIGRKRIQRLWVAEGFASSRHDMTAEEVAESYFNELANRFMIILSDFSANGKVKRFRVHDIMLELIASKSREERFMSLVVGNKDSEFVSSTVIRRLSIHGTSEHVEKNLSLSHVRSLTVQSGAMLMLGTPLSGMLRVLDLEGCEGLGTKHLKIVARLLHLRYLSLRGTEVGVLPGGIKRISKLETLDIRGTFIKKLPEGIIELQQLRFLNGIRRGTYLKIPRGIGRLSALQVLGTIYAEWSGKQAMKELREMTQLQQLGVGGLPGEWMEDFCESLTAMSGSLRSLLVWGWGGMRNLNRLTEPPLLLENLFLRGQLQQLPTWVLSLRNLAKLSLQDSRLEEDAIQSLGSLPSLIRLTLQDAASEVESLCFGARGFPRLKELRLVQLTHLNTVGFQRGAMCQLERVIVMFQYGAGGTRLVGITNLPALKELSSDTDYDEWVDEVKAQLSQHPNRPSFIKSQQFPR